MPKVPRISGQQAIRAFEKAGWKAVRQKGSHVALIKEGSIFTLSIPLHKELGPGLLRDQIRKAGLSLEEFIELI